jgi:hypothetical protein
MAAHRGAASSRPRCTRSVSSVAVIPVYHYLLHDDPEERISHLFYAQSMKSRIKKVYTGVGNSGMGCFVLRQLKILSVQKNSGAVCYTHRIFHRSTLCFSRVVIIVALFNVL